MSTLIAQSTGRLTVAIQDCRGSLDDVAFQSAAEIVESGAKLIVIDTGRTFDPARMTQSARLGAIEPAHLMKHLQIVRTPSAIDLEEVIHHLDGLFERLETRHVLLVDPLRSLFDPAITTRDAARFLGRIKSRLEELAEGGAHIVMLCCKSDAAHGTRSHFLSSLRSAADRVYLRSNT